MLERCTPAPRRILRPRRGSRRLLLLAPPRLPPVPLLRGDQQALRWLRPPSIARTLLVRRANHSPCVPCRSSLAPRLGIPRPCGASRPCAGPAAARELSPCDFTLAPQRCGLDTRPVLVHQPHVQTYTSPGRRPRAS